MLQGHCQQDVSEKSKQFRIENRKLAILFNEQVIPWKLEKEDINVPYAKTPHKIGFASPKDTITFMLSAPDTVQVDFLLGGQDTISILVIGQPNGASYNQNYIQEHNDTYKVYTPEVHELVNICIALSDIGKRDSNMVNMDSEYYQDVINHFDEYRNHPFIDSLNNNFNGDFDHNYSFYYNIRMNACMYVWDDDKIVNSSPYLQLSFGGKNQLVHLLPLLEEFSTASGFRQFYSSKKTYYDSLLKSYYELVPLDRMWTWVESKFPNKFQAYKVFFSPLIQGAHAAKMFSDNDFNESVMFVNAPLLDDKYSIKEKEAYLSRMVFTEIDHNYVNPMSDKFSEASTSMIPIECWNNNEEQWYGNGYATFNEYMTYAVFTLYMYDNFDQETFHKVNEDNNDLMAHGRGFIKFKAFNEFVLSWYKIHPNDTFDKLYTEVFDWINNESCE